MGQTSEACLPRIRPVLTETKSSQQVGVLLAAESGDQNFRKCLNYKRFLAFSASVATHLAGLRMAEWRKSTSWRCDG